MEGTAQEKKTVFAGLSEKIARADQGKAFFENIIVRFSLLGAFLLNLAGWTILALFIRPDQSVVILHYNVYFGVDLIGDWQQAYLIPVIGLLFLGVNLWLARWFYGNRERFAAYVLLLASIMIELAVAVAAGGVALVNY
jgi:hypothetical protein